MLRKKSLSANGFGPPQKGNMHWHAQVTVVALPLDTPMMSHNVQHCSLIKEVAIAHYAFSLSITFAVNFEGSFTSFLTIM